MLEPACSSKIEYSIYVQVKGHCKKGHCGGMNLIELNFMENLEGEKRKWSFGSEVAVVTCIYLCSLAHKE